MSAEGMDAPIAAGRTMRPIVDATCPLLERAAKSAASLHAGSDGRCAIAPLPSSPERWRQRFCLTARHADCPFFRAREAGTEEVAAVLPLQPRPRWAPGRPGLVAALSGGLIVLGTASTLALSLASDDRSSASSAAITPEPSPIAARATQAAFATPAGRLADATSSATGASATPGPDAGQSELSERTPEASATPQPTPEPDAPAVETATPTPEPALTIPPTVPAPAPVVAPTPTPVPPAPTPTPVSLPPTPTPIPAPQPTATPRPQPTATPAPQPTATPIPQPTPTPPPLKWPPVP